MFKHWHLKILSLAFAIIFWVVIVSLENNFVHFPEEIPIQVFNQAEGLALAEGLGTARLTLRTQSGVLLRNLSAADFEAYIDLRNAGVGSQKVSVSVTSRNPQVSVSRVDPAEVEVTLEPIREKVFQVLYEVKGTPADGFRVESVTLSRASVQVSGASIALGKISRVLAQVDMTGNEKESFRRQVPVKLYGAEGVLLSGFTIKDSDSVEASVILSASEKTKQVGVRAKFFGTVRDSVLKSVEVLPATVVVSGHSNALDPLKFLETEPIDLKDFAAGSSERKVKVVLPKGVALAEGETGEVTVKVEISKNGQPESIN